MTLRDGAVWMFAALLAFKQYRVSRRPAGTPPDGG